MTTLFQLIHTIGQELPRAWKSGTADTGSTTTIQDAQLGGADNSHNVGLALLTRDAGGAGVAPEGESRIVEDYDAKGAGDGDGLVTVETAFSVAVAVGDKYGIISRRYRKDSILEAINDSIAEIKLADQDDTTTDTASDTKEYAFPSGITPENLLQIWIATSTSAPWNWHRIYRYYIEEDDGAFSVRFHDLLVASRNVRWVHWARGLSLWADDDALDARINDRLIKWKAVVKLLERRRMQFIAPPARLTDKLNASLRRMAEVESEYTPTLPQATPGISITARAEDITGKVPAMGE